MLKLWDLQELLDGPPLVHDARLVEPDSDDDDMEPSSSKAPRSKKTGQNRSSSDSTSDFFADFVAETPKQAAAVTFLFVSVPSCQRSLSNENAGEQLWAPLDCLGGLDSCMIVEAKRCIVWLWCN